MANIFDTRKSCTPFDQNSTLIAVIELSQGSWLVGGIVPGLERSPAKKLNAKEKREVELLKLLLRWRDEAIKTGRISTGSLWHLSPGVTASGWRAG